MAEKKSSKKFIIAKGNENKIKNTLIQTLKEIFQFDKNDLDFGIYRILNIKKKEISTFIEKDLFEIIEQEMQTVDNSDELKKERDILKDIIEKTFGCEIDEARMNNSTTLKIQKYNKLENEIIQYQNQLVSQEEIFNHIINFFSRYYDNGDIISERRYSKNNKYAIPYNGEEVYLYWANYDQYFIKTGEIFTNFSFKIGKWKINFEIDAEDVDLEKTNIKDLEKKFYIFKKLEIIGGNLLAVHFGYRGLTVEEEKAVKKIVEKKTITIDYVNKYNLKQLQGKLDISAIPELREKHRDLSGKLSKTTELEWYLSKFTTKNTADYFIHKNLKKFSSRELDFYIKNEIFEIDDISTTEELNHKLKKIKAFKTISMKIIDFLAQIEDFQKKLWEKKKFVLSTDYFITLDYINEKYYPEILKNKSQIEEWKKLNLINFKEDNKKKIQKTLEAFGKTPQKLSIDLLKINPTLTIDTIFFDDYLKYQILSEIENFQEKITGYLIKSENFHGLNLLTKTFKNQINCCYIDPPYNTGGDGFLYKDKYKNSSWMSMIYDRLRLVQKLLSNNGFIFVSIDDNENAPLKMILTEIFGKNNFESQVIIQSNKRGQTYKSIAKTHEYILIYGMSENSKLNELPKEIKSKGLKDEDGVYELWELRNRNPKFGRFNRPNLFYPIYINPSEKNKDIYAKISLKKDDKYSIEVFPRNSENKDSCWRWGKEKVSEALSKKEFSILIAKQKRDGFWNIYQKARKSGTSPKSIWSETKMINERGTVECRKLGLTEFGFPKPIELIKRCVQIGSNKDSTIIDFFSGSGTTGHSVLRMNKEDGGKRKFILIEMAKYFDTVIKPRILKTVYSDDWKDNLPQNNNGSKKQIIKYQSLEQFEDSLQNIDFKIQNSLALQSKDYKIKYMLDFETKENPIFLNIDLLDNPFDYKLKIESNDKIRTQKVDLVETFNYIAGIFVDSILKTRNDDIDYVIVKGHREEKNVIVIWRNKSESFDPKKDKAFVEKKIIKDEVFDEILVNGNSLIENAKSLDGIFKQGMFEW